MAIFNDYKIVDDIVYIEIKKRDGKIIEAIIDTEDLQKIIDFGLRWSTTWNKEIKNYYVTASEYLGIENKNQNIKHTIYIGSFLEKILIL